MKRFWKLDISLAAKVLLSLDAHFPFWITIEQLAIEYDSSKPQSLINRLEDVFRVLGVLGVVDFEERHGVFHFRSPDVFEES